MSILHPNFTTHSDLNARLLDGTAIKTRHFRQLRELELVPDSTYKTLLSSITSIELRKIVIHMRHVSSRGVSLQVQRVVLWAPVDGQLCGLVDRLRATGHRHTLEVELRFSCTEGDPSGIDFTKLLILPGFMEKGVVTIVDAELGNRVFHSSTHNR